jgi:hypothetical protein
MNPIYDRKTAAKEGSCFVCNKFTTTVLKSESDWFYCCLGHLKDYSFCTILDQDPPPTTDNQQLKKEEDKKDQKGMEEKPTVAEALNQTKTIDRVKLHSSFLYLREKQRKRPQVNRKIEFPSVPRTPLK